MENSKNIMLKIRKSGIGYFLFVALSLCYPLSSQALPFDYYLDCSIRERDVHPRSPNPMESIVANQKYVVCVYKAISGSAGQAESNTIKGPSFDGKSLDDLSCSQLKTKNQTLLDRIQALRKFKQEAEKAKPVLHEVFLDADSTAKSLESTSNDEKVACDASSDQIDDLKNISLQLTACKRMRDKADRSECISNFHETNPGYNKAVNDALKICGKSNRSAEAATQSRTVAQSIADQEKALQRKINEISVEIAKAQVTLNRIKEANAEQSCPK